jgi:hypothetical protein
MYTVPGSPWFEGGEYLVYGEVIELATSVTVTLRSGGTSIMIVPGSPLFAGAE